MAVPNSPIPLQPKAQAAVVQYVKMAMEQYAINFNIRAQLEARDRAYYREEDFTTEHWRAKMANQAGDSSKIQNITVPVVMPQTESALANLSEIFLDGYPIFAAVAPPEQQEQLEQFDTIIEDNSTYFKWVPNLITTLRDGLKYDLGACEVTWEQEQIWSLTTPQAKNMEVGEKKEELYQGNRIKWLTPYNLILDTRVSPELNHEQGEFAGYVEMLSRIEAKRRMDNLPKSFRMNYTKAFETGGAVVHTVGSDGGFYMPQINPDALLPVESRMDFDWMKWSGLVDNSKQRIAYHNNYQWCVLYARILPIDLGMEGPNSTQIQIWKFVLLNSVVVYAERQTNAHNMLPIIICKPSNDGMSWQSKSFVENAMPAQQISTALVNSALASQRRKVYDRLFYDPVRVRKQDIDKVDSVSRIPVKNTQFGKGLSDAIFRLDYRDEGVAEVLQMSQQIVQMGEIANGQNRVQQGQFQKGNKTRREFETVMTNANSRQKMQARGLEFTFFTPIKFILRLNILQFQPQAKIFNPVKEKLVEVDPFALRGASIKFNLSDGMLSSEKMLSLDIGNTVLQAAQAVPQVGVEYDVMGMLAYTWELQGAHWIKKFKRDQTGKAAYLADMQATSTAQGQIQQEPPPPKIETPDAGARGALGALQ